MKIKLFWMLECILAGLLFVVVAQAGSLTDYGSTPALTQPQGNQLAANEKLDFHTDLFTGRFGYQVPIEAPPARGGMEPSVGLAYNSANKNSWCGVGWDLDFGYIQRETRYGIPIPVGGSSYSDNYGFTFSFQGHSGRLVSVGGGVYYPQVDTDYLKFVYTNGWWTVTDKSGRQYNFGETSASRISNTLGTFKWGLSSLHDPNGNLTAVSYTMDDGQMYLKEIDYNGNTNSPAVATNCSIAFDLASANRSDVFSTEIAGSEIVTEKILQDVRVLNQGNLVRRYQLTYITSPSTGRSLLQSVTEYGSDNTTALPSQSFTYSVQADQYLPSVAAWPVTPETAENGGTPWGYAPANPDNQLIDINGDGLPDWVTVANGPGYTYYDVQLNTGNGFSYTTPVAWSPLQEETGDGSLPWNEVDSSATTSGWSQSVACLLDINGDGLPDRVVRQHNLDGSGVYDHLQVQLNNGTSGFGSLLDWTGLNSIDPSFTGGVLNDAFAKSGDGEADLATMIDMNGDGLPDRVLEGSASGRFDVQINLGGTFSTLVDWNNVDAAGEYPYSPRCRDYSYVYSDLMDVNGDGLPDRILESGVQLNNGHGFDNLISYNYSGFPEQVDVTDGCYTWQLVDMNGDGLPDLVMSNTNGTYTVYFNTGRGFKTPGVTWSYVNTAGDGTSGWNNLQSWDEYGTKTMFVDVNGDGLLDRVERSYINGDVDLFVQLSQGPFPDLLISASNGIGGTVGVSYEPSTIYHNPDGTDQHMAFPVYVTSAVTVNDGRGNVGTDNYVYSGAYYDTTYKEFRGFYEVQDTDPLGMITLSFFHQGGGNSYNGSGYGEYQDDVAKAGMPFETETYGSDGKIYSETFNQVNESLLYNGTTGFSSAYFPFVQQTFKLDYEANAGYRATATGYSYDATGNLLCQTNYGEATNINVANYTFTTGLAGAPPPDYDHFTYAVIASNSNIIDHVASDTVTADAAGTEVLQQTLYQYFPVTGDLLQKCALMCPGSYATNSYTYDNYGNTATITDPMGIVTTMNYDSTATFVARKYTGTLADNLIEYSQYDPRSGSLLASTNEQGLVMANAYDVFLRLTNSATSTTVDGPATLWRKQYSYGLGGISGNNSLNYVRLWENDPASSTGYHETDTYLDGEGRPIQTREAAENGQYRVSDIVYDARGSVILQEYPQFQSGDSYSKPSGTRTNVYTMFDPVGRVSVLYPCASAGFNSSGWLSGTPSVLTGDTGSPVGPSSVAYKDGTNPWAIVTTNALGKVHKYYEDAFGRTNQIVEVTSAGNFITTLAYDQLDDLTNITDNAGNKIGFFYDDLKDRVALADPDMGFWQWTYDLDQRIAVQTDAKGQQLKYFYNDPAGRLTLREGFSAAGQQVSTNTWSYDSSGGDGSCTVYPGELYQITDDQGWQKFSYDVRDRTLESLRYLAKNENTYTNQYGFDNADRPNLTIYPHGGPTITNIFDSGENLSQVAQLGGSNTVFFIATGFNPLRQLLGISFGNGVLTSNTFYPASLRLEKIATSKTSTNLQSLTYAYDAEGNVKSVTDGVYTGLASASFGNILYDDLNRLTALTNASGSSVYAYDSVGNMLTNHEAGSGSYTYGTIRPDAVRTASGAWFTYDLNGNIVFCTGQRLNYDVNNRLYQVIATNGVITTFGYDADGARLWEQSGTNPLQVWIDGNYEEKNGQVLFHIDAASRSVCTFDSTGTNVYEYYHPDNLTSTAIQTDQHGNEIQNYGYSAFGQSRYTQSTTVFKVSRRYTGQVLDDATGLYFYYARYYDPQLGRFTQPDDTIPDLFNPQTYNRYAYCVNNPLRYTDPSGNVPSDWADSWSGTVDVAAGAYSAGPSHWIWNGTVGTADSLIGGLGEPLRLGSSAGAVSGDPNATKGQIAIAGVQEISRAASIVPIGAAAGKVTGTILTTVTKSAAKDAATTLGKDAASNLPRMKGMGQTEREGELSKAGFKKTKTSNSPGKNETWSHQDGSEVRVHPYGNVKKSPYKSGNNAHLHKQNPSGQQLNDRGMPSTDPNQTHIGLPNPSDFPTVRGRPSGS